MAGIRDNGLTPKQLKAITALLTGVTVVECAAQVGVTTKTIENWMKQPVFKTAYLKGKEQIREHGSVRIANAIDRCIDALIGNLKLRGKPQAVNRAAHILLSFGYGHCALEDMQRQIDELMRQNDADDTGKDAGSDKPGSPGDTSGGPSDPPSGPPPEPTPGGPTPAVPGDGLGSGPVADEFRPFD